jgi:thiamine-monophosphate kinase
MKNTTGTSDAEIIDIGIENHYLAVTIDGISEDIDLLPGITHWQIGSTAVNVNFSDLAAVGAKPIGILLSWDVNQNTD